MLLYLSVAICALLAGALVYRYDLYDREPWLILGLTALGGALSMPLVGLWEAQSLRLLSSVWVSPAAYAWVGASHEELFRFAGVWVVSRFDAFNDPVDGLVYGSILGLGMGLEESFHTLGHLAGPFTLVFPVELVRLFGHLIMGGIAGFGLGLGTIPVSRWRWRALGCLLVAVLLHFAWDLLAMVSPSAVVMPWWQTLVAIQVIAFGMLFYGVLVALGSRRSKHLFAPHSSVSLWGWPFTIWFRDRSK